MMTQRRRPNQQLVSLGITTALIAVVATVAWMLISEYGRYTVIEGVPRDSTAVPQGVLDVGVAPNGGLVGILTDSALKADRAVEVMAWDSAGATRDLFQLPDPAAPVGPLGIGVPSQLLDARVAPLAARGAALWRSSTGTLLTMGDGRAVDTPFPADGFERLAISADGWIVALAGRRGEETLVQVIRFAGKAPETLSAFTTPWRVTALAVAPSGRLAMADDSGRVRIVVPRDTAQLTFAAPGAVSRIAFLGDSRTAVVGSFDGVHVFDSTGASRIAAFAGGPTAGIAAQDSTLVAWVPGATLQRYTVRAVRRTNVAIASGIGIVAYLVAGSLAVSFLKSNRSRSRRTDLPVAPAGVALPTLAVPEAPSELVTACAKGDCVLFAGSGISAAASPTWAEFVTDLLEWAGRQGLLEPSFKMSLEMALSRGQINSVAYSIATTLEQTGHADDLQQYVRETFALAKGTPTPPIHRALAKVGFNAIVTHNLDTLLERTFTPAQFPVYTLADSEPLLACLSQRASFLLKLYGSIDRPPVMVAPAQLQAAVASSAQFTEFSQQLYVSRTLLFVGTSLAGITDYLESLTIHRTPELKHWALVAVDEAGWEVKAKLLRDRYGVHVLPFTPTSGYPEVEAFVASLEANAAEERARLERRRAEEQKHPAAIKRISLRNVGPFESLDLELDSRVTVILGDNGLGKSSMLKAIGLALAGSEHESSLAAGLIRVKPTAAASTAALDSSAQVMIETDGGKTYTTIIGRAAREGARIQFQPHAWQRGEGQLALGFPPLRSVSPKAVSSPQILEDRPRPLPSDVLPIVTGEPDSRVSDIKQWLVSLDYKRRTSADGTRIQRLLTDFFETVNELLEGVRIDFRGLDVEGGDVRVKTDDGIVPLHALSQGTISMIGLIGVLLPRMYDVHPTSPHPRQEFAIALIDELDAHMHPRWQQTLVRKLHALFPRVQFIVTTHSPFIAAGRERTQIIRLRRDAETRRITVEPTYADTKGVDVTSILTGYLFGLQTPVDPDTEEDLLARRTLVAAETLSEAQQEELRGLNVKLAGVVAGPTPDPEYNLFLRVVGERERERGLARVPASAEEEQAKLAIAREVLDELEAQEKV